ncbi:MAG: hypothetical protein OXC44_07260 [Proteobacteria bacterium]|nr:hypothetical protein [Pseudomonadota bacterium]
MSEMFVKNIKDITGFSLLEITVAASLFASVAYFVNISRGDNRRTVHKESQVLRMQTLQDHLITLVSFEPQNFPTFKNYGYYACYNRGMIMINNDTSQPEFGVTPIRKIKSGTDPNNPQTEEDGIVKCITEKCPKAPQCKGVEASFIAYIIPDNKDHITIHVLSVDISTNEISSILTTKVLKNYGY